jgi:hypothetical protein
MVALQRNVFYFGGRYDEQSAVGLNETFYFNINN